MRLRRHFRQFAAAASMLAASTAALADAPTPSAPSALSAEIAAVDTAMFDGFNQCDKPGQLDKYLSYFAADVEFFHDNAGLATGIERQRTDTAKNVCGKFARKLVAGSFEVFPIRDYGAISRGVHQFCRFDSAACEGEADFLIIYRKEKDGSWKITRAVSYAHRPLPAPPAAAGAVTTAPTTKTASGTVTAPPMLLPKPTTSCFQRHKEGEDETGYCHAVRVGDTLYISGTIGIGSMPDAVEQVYSKLEDTLRQHGLGFEHVVKENVYTLDLDAFIAANDKRKAYYAGVKPAATWVQVERLFLPQFVLEVELVATIPK